MTLVRTMQSVIQHRSLALRDRPTDTLYLKKNSTDGSLVEDSNGIAGSERKKERCIHTTSWQSSHHPSCNAIHELDLVQTSTRLLTSGSYRHVWSFQEYNGDARVLKTLHYKRDFDSKNFDRHRRDAVIMERLSSSNHIVDIHGHCSNSVLVDYTRNGDLTFLHRQGETRPSMHDMLQIAHDVSAAIADLHDAGIVHADIKPNQFLNFEGRYKLNDFNRAHFVKQSVDTNETCGFTETNNVGVVRTLYSTSSAGKDKACILHTHIPPLLF